MNPLGSLMNPSLCPIHPLAPTTLKQLLNQSVYVQLQTVMSPVWVCNNYSRPGPVLQRPWGLPPTGEWNECEGVPSSPVLLYIVSKFSVKNWHEPCNNWARWHKCKRKNQFWSLRIRLWTKTKQHTITYWSCETLLLEIRTLLSETFMRNTNVLSMNLNFCMTLKTVSIPLTDSKFFF